MEKRFPITDLQHFARGKEPEICSPGGVCLLKKDDSYRHIYIQPNGISHESNTLRYFPIKEDGTLGCEQNIFPIPDVYAAPGCFLVCITVHKLEPTQLKDLPATTTDFRPTHQIISDQRREDMIIGALEGGSNYWYLIPEEAANTIEKYQTNPDEPYATIFYKAIKAGESIPIQDIEENGLLGHINLESIAKGEKTLFEKYPHHYKDIIAETDDAITADVWFQLAIMNELVYG